MIRSRLGFVLLALARGSARSLKAGEYEIPQGANTVAVLEPARGRPGPPAHAVLFREGGTLAELARAARDASGWPAPTTSSGSARDPVFLKTLDIEAETLEGYLFPDTYQFVKGMTPEEILARMVTRMREQISRRARWSMRAAAT